MGAKKKAFCKSGHLRHYDRHGNCMDCNAIRQRIYRLKNHELVLSRTKLWRTRPESKFLCKMNQKQWIANHYQEYRLKSNRRNKEWRMKNLDEWRKLHRNAEACRRQRHVKFGQEGIKQFYLNCPDGFHVDHKIPLKGICVSGLHVIWNLQYLTAHENQIKSNKFQEVTA